MPRYRCPYVSEMRDRFRVPRTALVDSVGVDRIGASAEEKESLTGAAEQLSSPEHDEGTLEKKKVEVEMNDIDGGKEEDVEKAEKVMKSAAVSPTKPRPVSSVFDVEFCDFDRDRIKNLRFFYPNAKTSLFITCSALYGILLITICIAFLTAEVVTHSVPLHYFEGFFTYLYIVSILFLLYVFCFLLHESSCCGSGRPKYSGTVRSQYFQNVPRDVLDSPVREKLTALPRAKKFKTSENDHSHGSFFLRIGGIGFGLGTMIYNGLELGSFFEIPWTSPCYQVLRGINPILQMVFTFSQMYFVFMNARLNIHKFKCVARFGLMHVVAANVCVWLRTVVKETTRDISHFKARHEPGMTEDAMILEGYRVLSDKFGSDSIWVNGPYNSIMNAFGDGVYNPFSSLYPSSDNDPVTQALSDANTAPYASPVGQVTAPYYQSPTSPTVPMNGLGSSYYRNYTCGRTKFMGEIVSFATPYLYPFLIQYSLIAGAVLFVMWKHIGKNPRFWGDELDDHISVASRKMTNYAKTDCVGASKGLFFGLLTLVSGLICLILFFVLIDHENKQVSRLAVFLADISHTAILILSILAIFLGFMRVQKMKFHGEETSILGDYLLRISAVGIFAYSVFNVIAGLLGRHTDLKNILLLATGGVSIVQVMLQLLFITDAQRRRIHTSGHDAAKPGRQVVTFLLICNLTMWIIYTFEVQKVKDSPVQDQFYGFYAWTIIQRITLPLCIFFRFHSTVILAEIWKNSYKAKLVD